MRKKIATYNLIFAILLHVFGYSFWGWFKQYSKIAIYYVSIYYLLCAAGLYIETLATERFDKFVGRIFGTIAFLYLGQEIFSDPQNWTAFDMSLGYGLLLLPVAVFVFKKKKVV